MKAGSVLLSARRWVFSEESCAWVKERRGSLFARYRAGKCDMGGVRGSGEARERGLASKRSEGMGSGVCTALLVLPKSHTNPRLCWKPVGFCGSLGSQFLVLYLNWLLSLAQGTPGTALFLPPLETVRG